MTQLCGGRSILNGRKDVNLDAVLGLLDLDVDVVLEVVHEPKASVAPPVLLEASGIDRLG